MSRPRVVLLRGHSANPWDLRPWELLVDRFDIRVLATASNAYDVDSGLELPVDRIGAVRDWFPRGRIGDLSALAVGDRYLRLEDALGQVDIVHGAEIGVPFSHGPALPNARRGFRLSPGSMTRRRANDRARRSAEGEEECLGAGVRLGR